MSLRRNYTTRYSKFWRNLYIKRDSVILMMSVRDARQIQSTVPYTVNPFVRDAAQRLAQVFR
jgi:ribosome biogenesis GTPase A